MKITYILLLAIILIASTSAFRVKTDTDLGNIDIESKFIKTVI